MPKINPPPKPPPSDTNNKTNIKPTSKSKGETKKELKNKKGDNSEILNTTKKITETIDTIESDLNKYKDLLSKLENNYSSVNPHELSNINFKIDDEEDDPEYFPILEEKFCECPECENCEDCDKCCFSSSNLDTDSESESDSEPEVKIIIKSTKKTRNSKKDKEGSEESSSDEEEDDEDEEDETDKNDKKSQEIKAILDKLLGVDKSKQNNESKYKKDTKDKKDKKETKAQKDNNDNDDDLSISNQMKSFPLFMLFNSSTSGGSFGDILNNVARKRDSNVAGSESVASDNKRQKLDAIDREYKSILHTKDKDDYEYFCGLNIDEKTKIIEEEKRVKEISNDKMPLRMKVMTSSLPPIIKGEIIRKLASSKYGFGGNPKMMDWVEHIMRVPWSTYFPMPISISDDSNKISNYMMSIYNRMDQAVCGHSETKCHIIQIIGKWITNPTAVGNCLALQGPMGVGKTTLVKEGLAPALGRPFNFISLGGATDASFLEGHSFTYEGSIPGQMVEVIQRSKCMNPIIYFDELDKISKSHRGEEIANLLIHITDTQQNDKFHDKYFGNIDIDLSKVFFVFSYNHDENVPPILKDRLQVVRIKGYNSNQKCKIANEYMFPRFCTDMGFKPDELKITDDVISYIISNFADKEEGVRNLGRCLDTLVSRLNVLRLIQRSTMTETAEFLEKLPFKAKDIPLITNNFLITREIIDNILDRPKVDVSHHHMYL
jgi:ATP-dependent Lon protease